jgi:hypothetical protein
MTAFVQAQLPAVPSEDLPLLLRYLLQNATQVGRGPALPPGLPSSAYPPPAPLRRRRCTSPRPRAEGARSPRPQADAPAVVAALRAALHFVEPADPRLAVPDVRQKGPAHAAGGAAAAGRARCPQSVPVARCRSQRPAGWRQAAAGRRPGAR